jgi:hypothetical protein
MAFCPECGKPATAEATKCAHCGHDLAGSEKAKPAGSARFKGTMIMAPAPQTAPSAQAAPAAQPAPAAAPAPAPTPAPAPASVSPKPGLKATMIAANVPAAAPPAAPPARDGAEEQRKQMAFAATAPQQAAFVMPAQPAPGSPSAPHAATAPTSNRPAADAPDPASSDEHTKYLPGDPMAPTHEAARPHHAQRHTGAGADVPKSNTWLWVGLGCLGMIVIGGIGIAIAVRLGLMH